MSFPIRCFSCGRTAGHNRARFVRLIQRMSRKEALNELKRKCPSCRALMFTTIDVAQKQIDYNRANCSKMPFDKMDRILWIERTSDPHCKRFWSDKKPQFGFTKQPHWSDKQNADPFSAHWAPNSPTYGPQDHLEGDQGGVGGVGLSSQVGATFDTIMGVSPSKEMTPVPLLKTLDSDEFDLITDRSVSSSSA